MNIPIHILGGEGLLGKAIVEKFIKSKVNVLSLDIVKSSNIKSKYYKFAHFDCTNMFNDKKITNNFFINYKCPKVFINCSYPRTDDWAKCNFNDISLNLLKRNIDMHLSSYAWISSVFANKMKNLKIKGNIINFGSMYGNIIAQDNGLYKGTSMKENYAYNVIKAGIGGASRMIASYFGKYGIRSNLICPGAITGHVAGKSNKQSSTFKRNFIKKVPLRRLALPNEIANVVFFLASDESSYITGAEIVVDGGWSII